MIEISRALARRFRAVLRRSVLEADPRGPWPVVRCQADRHGLALEACGGDLAVRYRRAGTCPPEVLAVPGALLAELEGRAETPVTLEAAGSSLGRLRWDDGGVPRAVDFEAPAPEAVPGFPELPKEYRDLPAGFLAALAEATRTTAKDTVRFALTRVQLRGRAGQIVATDGKQLLVQGGFPFPWAEDVLVPRLPVALCRDPELDGPVRVGRTPDAVAVLAGPWTFLLRIDKDGRFPNVDHVVPRQTPSSTRLCLDRDDAAFLAATLPRLPGRDDDHAPVTLDLDQPPAVRARVAGEGPATEVVLARSTVSGKPLRLCVDRRQLLRGLQLGFTEIQASDASTALACRDAQREYVYVPLNPEAALAPDPAALRVTSTPGKPVPSTPPERRTAPMPAPQPSGPAPDNNGKPGTPAAGIAELVAEGEALRDLLHEAGGRAARLVAALKQQRRQSRAVQAAMASLR